MLENYAALNQGEVGLCVLKQNAQSDASMLEYYVALNQGEVGVCVLIRTFFDDQKRKEQYRIMLSAIAVAHKKEEGAGTLSMCAACMDD